jgi:hypothetical protein
MKDDCSHSNLLVIFLKRFKLIKNQGESIENQYIVFDTSFARPYYSEVMAYT